MLNILFPVCTLPTLNVRKFVTAEIIMETRKQEKKHRTLPVTDLLFFLSTYLFFSPFFLLHKKVYHVHCLFVVLLQKFLRIRFFHTRVKTYLPLFDIDETSRYINVR